MPKVNIEDLMKGESIKVESIDYSEKKSRFKSMKAGVIMPKYCNCGKYQPTSTRGVINSNCRNCGGKKKPSILK